MPQGLLRYEKVAKFSFKTKREEFESEIHTESPIFSHPKDEGVLEMDNNMRNIELQHIQDGDVIFITACSQCASRARVTLDGAVKTKIELVKQSEETKLTRLEGGYSTEKVGNGPVFLKIDIDNHEKMKVIKNIFIMSDINGKEQGLSFLFNVEDATDEDFNDYLVHVVTWHKRG